jgi:hypothetical protein
VNRVFLLQNTQATLDLNDYRATGLAISAKDLGSPNVREDTQDVPTQDGTQDSTAFFGQRVIQITGKAFNRPGASRSKAWDLMQPFLDPKQRTTLTYQMDDDMTPRLLTGLRIAQWSKGASSPTGFAFQVQWKADPVALDQNVQLVSTDFAYSGSIGRTYNRTYPLSYPAGAGGSGVVVATSNGTYTTWPTYQIYGPWTNPVITLLGDLGAVLGQVGLLMSIPVNQYVEINSKLRTVILYDGSTGGGSSRYQNLDFMNLLWTPMQPGDNTFRFTASAAVAPAYCHVIWQDAFLA